MVKAEKNFLNYFKSHILLFAGILLTLISMIIRNSALSFESGDYLNCLTPWFSMIKDGGGLITLKDAIADYNIPYVFILTLLTYLPVDSLISIKITSIIFDYIAAASAGLIVYYLLGTSRRSKFISVCTFIITIFLPTVIINSSFWAQCDVIYTCFVLLCILFLLKENYTAAFIYFGIAFSFKLQAVFVLPLLIILYFANSKFSMLKFLIIPAVFFVGISPALIAGRPLDNILKIYINQPDSQPFMNSNYPNLYVLLNGSFSDFKLFAIGLTMAVLGLMALYVIYNKIRIKSDTTVSLALWSVFVCVFFLPAMHERYAYMIDILSVVYFMVKHKNIYIPIGINLISLIAYTPFLIGDGIHCVIPLEYLALVNLVLLILFTKDLICDFKSSNQTIKESKILEVDLISTH